MSCHHLTVLSFSPLICVSQKPDPAQLQRFHQQESEFLCSDYTAAIKVLPCRFLHGGAHLPVLRQTCYKRESGDASLDIFGALWYVLARGMRRSKARGFISIPSKSVPQLGGFFFFFLWRKKKKKRSKKLPAWRTKKGDCWNDAYEKTSDCKRRSCLCLRRKRGKAAWKEWQHYTESQDKAGITDFNTAPSLPPHTEAWLQQGVIFRCSNIINQCRSRGNTP